MLLRITEDFTSTVTLDAQLLATADSGLSINEGVHPSITTDNLLKFLPNTSITPAAYVAGTTYTIFEDSRLLSDVVTDGGLIYQSLTTANVGNTPASSASDWLLTNMESLRLKAFIESAKNRAISDLNLIRRHVDNQYLYNLVEQNDNITATLLPNDYAGWQIEPKGSDYTRITINQMALQATTASSQSLYVINQGQLITTLTLNPNLEGRLAFEEINYDIPANKGIWIFAIDSQNVLTQGGYLDPLKYDGFVPRLVSGTGASPQAALYSNSSGGNGLSFNITVHFDPTVYLTNNLKNFGKFLRACFELQALRMFRSNSNNVKNGAQLVQMNEAELREEVLNLEADTSARRYREARKEAINMLDKTYDREIENNEDDSVSITLSPH